MAQLHASMKRLSWLSLQSLKQLHLQRQARTRWLPLLSQTQAQRRSAHSDSQTSTSKNSKNVDQQQQAHDVGRQLREEWSTYSHFPQASAPQDYRLGNKVTVHGFLSRRRVKHSKLVFADIQVDNRPAIQIVSSFETPESPEHEITKSLRAIPLYSPVSVTGTITKLHSNSESTAGQNSDGVVPDGTTRVDLDLASIQPLNAFPKNIIVSEGVQFPPSSRHLQIRFSDPLRTRLQARPKIGLQLRKTLDSLGFTEVETPVLFKSTPEGAREFLVPTRRPGLAYALPQSPQQYKQMLMSSGVRGYYQFARCFRDEDLRADRQPEFTQLDLEMSFATGEDVMRAVESIVSEVPVALNAQFHLEKKGDEIFPASGPSSDPEQQWPSLGAPFIRMTYEETMTRFGIDKPDLRIPFEIRRIDQVLSSSFVSMISGLEKPVVEAFRFRPQVDGEVDVNKVSEFAHELMKTLPTPLAKNPDGAPAALVVNSKKPLMGLSALGFESVDALTSGAAGLEDFQDLEDGDVIVFQAREDKPFQGGSTALGTARNLCYQSAVANGLLPRDLSFKFLWVTNFPMFTPDNDADPGQGGEAGFSATHHPFTAPLTDADVELLATDPLKARADHYDLVVNGVELGGGSRRIHLAKMQEYIMREILKMNDAGVAQFSHLLEALRAGCPPHAGFALGFDRLVAVFTHTDSVRDVIAFPKSMKGEDLTVKSPSKMTKGQLETYHLAFAPKK